MSNWTSEINRKKSKWTEILGQDSSPQNTYLGECLWLVQIIIDLHNEHVNRLPINVSLISVALKKAVLVAFLFYLEVEYLVTALVPSLTACLTSSPGRINLTEVWTSLDEIVDFLL